VRRRRPGAEIASIEPGSIAQELGLLPGDVVLRVNGRPMLDVLDYQRWTAEPQVRLDVARGQEIIECDVEKDEDESLGIRFTDVVFDGVRRCRCQCVFCFVDNLPKGLRPSLYLKDDDYRLSFLHGNFITLENLREADWQRILRLRLSPL
jgi:NifB/MoaA-like Fe-S oxidoreductase